MPEKVNGPPDIREILLDGGSAGSSTSPGFGIRWGRVALIPTIAGRAGSEVPFAYAAGAHLADAKRAVDSLENPNPSLPMMLSLLEAEVLLAAGFPDSAIHCYRRAPVAPPRMGIGWRMAMYNVPRQRDVIPRAFQAKGEPDSAAAEYERMLKIDPSGPGRRLIEPRFHYRLARLCEQGGNADRAVAEYRRFLEIWKNADPDRPEFLDARRRLASLTR